MDNMTDEQFIKELERRADAFFNECLKNELEKLKSEIKDEEYSTNWLVSADTEKGWNDAIEYAIGKIDYYIEELKGVK